MTRLTAPRLDHLRRMTDSRGLVRAATGDCPDRFAGYDTISNADALRLCALASDSVDVDTFRNLAGIYYRFLCRARRADGGVHHACSMKGAWTDDADDQLVQSHLGRALAAVIVSELPIEIRLAASEWWRQLIRQVDNVWSPRAAGNWLMAIGQLRAADPGRDLRRAEALARWIVEDCFYATRSADWEWFESRWTPLAASVPAGLWCAGTLTGESRYATVAETATQFVIDHLFEDGLFLPVGTRGGWSVATTKAVFDQTPAETCSVVELLCLAEHAGSMPGAGRFAEYAARWFEGNNVKGESLIDTATGACHGAVAADGVGADCTGQAVVSYLLTHAALSARPVIVAEAPVYAVTMMHG